MGELQVTTVARPRHPGEGRWRHRGMVVAALALTFGLVNGVSGASAPSTDVAFTPVTPFKVMNAVSIGAGATRSAVVIGGSTTVPSNATTVRLTITVKGPKAGSLSFFPAGNPAGSSGDTVAWTAGDTTTSTIETDIGEKDKLSVRNHSTGTAQVTATLIAYSQEVEADDISSIGGTVGQVLTDTGSGAGWRTPSPAFSARNPSYAPVIANGSTIATQTVPAGTYRVEADLGVYGAGATAYVQCILAAPNGAPMDERFANVDPAIQNASLSMQGVVVTPGGAITVRCHLLPNSTDNAFVYGATIIATKVGSVTGHSVSGRVKVPRQTVRSQPAG